MTCSISFLFSALFPFELLNSNLFHFELLSTDLFHFELLSTDLFYFELLITDFFHFELSSTDFFYLELLSSDSFAKVWCDSSSVWVVGSYRFCNVVRGNLSPEFLGWSLSISSSSVHLLWSGTLLCTVRSISPALRHLESQRPRLTTG